MKYIVELSDREVVTLEEGHKHGGKAHFRHRCLAILLRHKGKSVRYISDLLEVRQETVYDWTARWQTLGLVGLMILPGRGVKAPLDDFLNQANQVSSDFLNQLKKK